MVALAVLCIFSGCLKIRHPYEGRWTLPAGESGSITALTYSLADGATWTLRTGEVRTGLILENGPTQVLLSDKKDASRSVVFDVVQKSDDVLTLEGSSRIPFTLKRVTDE